ncbi:MAG: PPC domain-containing protein [Elainella sp. Prado103]|nr:PPC domain-containing protein [Elainella sp. Prado103]
MSQNSWSQNSWSQNGSVQQAARSLLFPASSLSNRNSQPLLGVGRSALRASPGDSRSRALRIKSSSFSRKDRVGEDEGNDYYRFDLSRRSEVEIEVENREFFLGPSLTFRLQRSNGSTIKSRKVFGNNDETIERTLDRGTYYIRVSSGGESVPYRLEYDRSDD